MGELAYRLQAVTVGSRGRMHMVLATRTGAIGDIFSCAGSVHAGGGKSCFVIRAALCY